MDYIENLSLKFYGINKLKGIAIDIRDLFLYKIEEDMYVVSILTKSSLNGKGKSLNYAIYSVKDDMCLDLESELYQKIVSDFPSLESPILNDGNEDFLTASRLNDKLEELINGFGKDKILTESLQNQYIEYLKEKQNLQPTTIKEVYKFFKEAL